MLKIAVCDDDDIMRRKIISVLYEYCEKIAEEYKIFPYSEGSELLKEQDTFEKLL